jgi:hypothetical protein
MNMLALRTPFSSLRKGSLFVLTSALLMLFVSGAFAGQWQGTETKDADGVVHVVSPAEPSDGNSTIDLQEQWRIGGDTDDEDQIFGLISKILTDDAGNLYALDSQLSEIKVFSPEGEYLRTIGREGEGPGEFRAAQDMFFLPNGNIAVMQVFPGRLVVLERDGEPANDHPLPSADEGGFVLLTRGGGTVGQDLVLCIGIQHFAEGVLDRNQQIVAIDDEGNIQQTLHSAKRTLTMSTPIFDESKWTSFDQVWTVGNDGLVYIPTAWDEYQIKVCNDKGVVRYIERAYDPRKRTGKEKDRWQKIYDEFTKRQLPNATWKLEDNDRDVARIFPRADGSIWVLSSRGQLDVPEGAVGVFDVFDAKGHYRRQITLKGEGNPMTDGYFFSGNNFYVVTDFLSAAMTANGGSAEVLEDENPEPMAVICYKLDGSELGMQ